MADRILTWHRHTINGNETRIGPTYYMEADYEPLAVRIHAETAAEDGDVEVDILDDDVSIFNNRASTTQNLSTTKGATTTAGTATTTAVLTKGENAEVDAEDLIGETIEQGSWVSCKIESYRDAKNLTVHLELVKVSEGDEAED